MSSKRKHSSHTSRRPDPYPTDWTEWEWNAQYQRNVRARELSRGEWEYEYAQPQIVNDQGLQPTPYTPRGSEANIAGLPSIDEHNVQYQEENEPNYSIAGITQGMENTQLEEQSKRTRKGKSKRKGYSNCKEPRWDSNNGGDQNSDSDFGDSHHSETAQSQKTQYPDAQAAPGQTYSSGHGTSLSSSSQYFTGHGPQDEQHMSGSYPVAASFQDPSLNTQSAVYPSSPTAYRGYSQGGASLYGSPRLPYIPPSTNISSKNLNNRHELDKRFKVRRSSEFEFGRVFKVLWSEPKGAGGTEITAQDAQPSKYGEKAYHKIRRFLVVKNDKGHSICLPILTYGNRGVVKPGVHAETHTVVYSSKRDGYTLAEGEEGRMHHRPIRVEIKDPSDKLDPMSRLNYAKIYTVEHNVKVLFIGRVAENYEQLVVTAFNETHPPLSDRQHGYRPDSPDVATSYAQQTDPQYPSAIPIPMSSAPYGSSGQMYGSSYPATASYPPIQAQPGYSLSYSAQPQIPTSRQPENPAPDDHHQPDYDDGYDRD
ncbi:hypothetical protein L207DRAFT_633837 [Hyaloscypha variabilis F]|uniref:DUF6590 domain-containing protein n=1 Tax=Hyaloscypha variabilis (strain UAMH 11265 / GT02V1 / F) TaxID=1149755 RepID=A0A2J6RQV8_HYAVF|nr:hypothetical protein L207DRAFT_633837 [Hyaloscypha variabilis F]